LGLKYIIVNYDDSKLFTLFKLDLTDSAPNYDFYNCHKYTVNIRFLNFYKGKIFRCARPMLIPYFNEHFNTDFKVRDGDFIDIYKTTVEEIYSLKLTRAPFCGYHNSANYSLIEWGQTDRSIEEWVHYD